MVKTKKLKYACVNENDVLVLVKVKENKRFGWCSHESFELNDFKKKDSKSFLFYVDGLKMYKSKNEGYSIFWNSNVTNSINFWGGTDMKISHKFLTKENYTNPNGNNYYDYKGEEYSLNG